MNHLHSEASPYLLQHAARLDDQLTAAVTVLEAPTQDYPLLHGRLTFYVCKDRSCMPPVNQLDLDR